MPRLTLLVAAALLLGGSAHAATDPLATPARPSELAQRRLITSLARAGDQAVVAVGQRGHALRSVDGGKTWVQGKVPVASDLASVQFVDARIGHAVGQDGVVLRTEDGGVSWTRVLDGRTANALLLKHMQQKVDAGGSEDDRKLLTESKRNLELGPDKPFLDLWFANANTGFVVGAYNLIFQTLDGGKTWLPWFDRTDNPKLLNLYAIRPANGSLFVAGEGGLLMKLDPTTQRFKALPSEYNGSYFGVIGTSSGVIAFGMRGHAFISHDDGQHWTALVTGLTGSITAGDVGADGRVVLVDQAGGVALSTDRGATFTRAAVPVLMPLAAVALTPEGAVLGGPRGLRPLALSKDRP